MFFVTLPALLLHKLLQHGEHHEPWYTLFQVWYSSYHDFLHIHEIIYEFLGHEMLHMNS